jgi:hypothetical protein
MVALMPIFENTSPNQMRAVINEHKVASLVTFPDITGRDAPGKTGSAAKPALITKLVVYLGTDENQFDDVYMRQGVWSSTGTNFSGGYLAFPDSVTDFSDPSTFPSTAAVSDLLTPRPVFSGVQYYFGALLDIPSTISTSPPTYYFGVRTSVPKNTAFDTTPTSTSTNFSKDGDRANIELSYSATYATLPVAPEINTSSVTGPLDLDIYVSWEAPSDDGGNFIQGYRIQRSTNDGATWSTIVANTGTTETVYIDENLVPGTGYTYRVAAINGVAIAHGADYSGPYSERDPTTTIPDSQAGNAESLLTATVANPEPLPLVFSDFGPGIRFTDIQVQYGAEYLYTRVEATTQDDFAELQVAEAPESKARYGVRTYSVTGLLNSEDSGAFDVAKDLLTYYYQPELRLESVTVDLANLTLEQKLQVLQLEIDSYISVVFTPNGIGDPKISSGLITSISHQITLTSHKVELRLRNERTLFTLDSESKGILNVNILGP